MNSVLLSPTFPMNRIYCKLWGLIDFDSQSYSLEIDLDFTRHFVWCTMHTGGIPRYCPASKKIPSKKIPSNKIPSNTTKAQAMKSSNNDKSWGAGPRGTLSLYWQSLHFLQTFEVQKTEISDEWQQCQQWVLTQCPWREHRHSPLSRFQILCGRWTIGIILWDTLIEQN